MNKHYIRDDSGAAQGDSSWLAAAALLVVLVVGAAVLMLAAFSISAAVSAEWRVNLIKGTTTVTPASVGATQEAAWAACQARIPKSATTTSTWKCQTPVYVAIVSPDPAPTTCPPKPVDETRAGTCPTGTTGTWTQARTYASAAAPTCWVAGEWLPATSPSGVCVAPPPTGTPFVSINAGGSALGAYKADQYFVGGEISTSCNRTVAGVYLSRRFSSTPFEYRIPAPNGTYRVKLLWHECWHLVAGGRVLRASIEGQAIPAFDVWKAGGAAIAEERAITLTDGVINVAFTPMTGDAMVNAIEVIQTSVAPPPPPGTGTAALTWTPPTLNTDGSALTNLAGYRIDYGTAPTELTRSISVPSASTLRYVVEGLSAGTWYFAVTVRNSTGAESTRSNTASRILP
jgi:hypothetical protein